MDTIFESPSSAAVTAHMAIASTKPMVFGATPVCLVPDGFNAESMEKHLPAPARKRGNTTLRDAASFIEFVKQEAQDNTRIYGCYDPPAFTAVFNDTSRDSAAWRDNLAQFKCPVSDEWLTWSLQDGKQMTQTAFAQFIENNLPDIVKPKDSTMPDATTMLEVSRTLEAKKKVNFSSGIRLSNGENQVTFEEEVSGTAGKGQILIPEMFTIGVPVIEGIAPCIVECRLRYRIGDGRMAMWYELVRPHKIMEHVVKEVWAQIQSATGLTVLNGSI